MTTDPHRLRQVLNNLLANAFKFTKHGEIALRIEPSEGSAIAFSVTDTGIGIKEELHKVMFEAFAQADGSTARKYGGTGLGLSISRNLVDLLGGEITLASAPGRGSTFTVRLPLEPDGVLAEATNGTPASTPSPFPPATTVDRGEEVYRAPAPARRCSSSTTTSATSSR